jgi:hypothetical protein
LLLTDGTKMDGTKHTAVGRRRVKTVAILIVVMYMYHRPTDRALTHPYTPEPPQSNLRSWYMHM